MGHISYSFKKESLTLKYGQQYICFHSFYAKEKKSFKEFSQIIQKRKPQDIIKVISMARERNISSQSGKPPVDSVIIF